MSGVATETDVATEDFEAHSINHYVVMGRESDAEDFPCYVQASTATEAEDIFKADLLRSMENKENEIHILCIIQIPDPPIAFYTADDFVENPEPLKGNGPS